MSVSRFKGFGSCTLSTGIKAFWDGMRLDGSMVIIGHRSSTSTFGANKNEFEGSRSANLSKDWNIKGSKFT